MAAFDRRLDAPGFMMACSLPPSRYSHWRPKGLEGLIESRQREKPEEKEHIDFDDARKL